MENRSEEGLLNLANTADHETVRIKVVNIPNDPANSNSYPETTNSYCGNL